MADISVFATGGIGGVHRGAEKSFDISADIIELGKTPVTVVCAGIKSILDIGKTLEMLETHGVPVLGYQAESFPAFFTNDSGFPSPLVVQSCSEVAAMMVSQRLLGLRSGIVLGVPNPQPAAMEKMQYAIDFALKSAANEGVSGPAITPYVLQRIERLTDGDSLQANVSLILNNAKLAAMVAEQHCSLLRSGSFSTALAAFSPLQPPQQAAAPAHLNAAEDQAEAELAATSSVSNPPAPTFSPPPEQKSVLVVGGAVMDIIGQITSDVHMGSSNPGTVCTSFGGVARNVAASIARHSGSTFTVRLATALADDFNGRSLLAHCEQIGLDTSAVKVLPQERGCTAVYNAIHDSCSGELRVGVADMSVLQQIDTHYVKMLAESVSSSVLVVADGNLSSEAFSTLANICSFYQVPLCFEPTSDHKCLLPFHANAMDKVSLWKPNLSELVQMASYCLQQGWVLSGRAQVQTTLSQLVAGRVDGQLADMALADVRILTHAVYQVLMACSNHSSSSRSEGSRAGINRRPPLLTGRHVVVSLGPRGVLWCGPPSHLLQDKDATSTREPVAGLVSNPDSDLASWHVPAMQVGDLGATNGAGDALLGGVLLEALQQAQLPTNGPAQLLPNIACIRTGLLHAHECLLSNRSKKAS